MASYRYQNGDRPLDGFTIEHAVGRGGFGEVYYAVSDSGRQVALKAVQNYEDIELRGISHCMNLKSPHLVSIFDVKYSDRNDPFVIMEYVAGPSLRQLLDESPEGLGPEKAAWFVREIGKGIALLHDNGIVHRDLKPHNVFVEDEYVKVGDYSLSKVITTSHRSGHTVTVGTVHYMAPEISLGRYDRSVDIYALGVMLYEMLTGKPPFLGETMPEVLMKHMSQDVDVSGLAEPYASVVRKAMARDPEERYSTIEEMVEALFGSDIVRDGVSTFSPQSLTVLAQRAAVPTPTPRPRQEPAVAQSATADYPRQTPQREPKRQPAERRKGAGWVYHFGRFWGKFSTAFALRTWPHEDRLTNEEDTLGFRFRCFLGLCTIVLAAATTGTLAANMGTRRPEEDIIFAMGLAMAAIVLSSKLVARYLSLRLTRIPWYVHRLLFAAPPLLPVAAIFGISGAFGRGDDESFGMGFAAAISMLVMDWRWLVAPVRPQRILLPPCLLAGFIGMCVAAMADDDLALAGFGMMAGTALTVQVVSRFALHSSKHLARSTEWIASLADTIESWYTDHSRPGGHASPTFTPPGQPAEPPAFPHTDEEQAYNSAFDPPAPPPVAASVTPTVTPVSDVGLSTSTVDPGEPKSRVAALALGLIPFGSFGLLPVFGLHRFYAGKYVTGFLWLITFGVLGIGQLIDIVMIAVGEFKDRRGRHLTIRQLEKDEPVNGLSAIPSSQVLVNGTLAFFGAVVLTIDILLGGVLAVNIPKAIKSDVFAEMDLRATEVEQLMGTSDWDHTVFDLAALMVAVIGVAAVGLLIVSRRSAGFPHMVRVIVAGAGFIGAFFALGEAAYYIRWDGLAMAIQQEQIIPAVDSVIGGDFIPFCLFTMGLLTAALLVLAWPPRRSAPVRPMPLPVRDSQEQRV